jgi:acyl carrier protein
VTDRIDLAVFAALSRQLRVPDAELRRQSGETLERLGLDSHGLMRVLLDIERELKLAGSLDLPDDALENPATLVRGVMSAMGD